MLNRIVLVVDVLVLFVDAYAVVFLLAARRNSKHCYPLVYRVDVPRLTIQIIFHFSIDDKQQSNVQNRCLPLSLVVLSFAVAMKELEK
jgi:hypothetical protein